MNEFMVKAVSPAIQLIISMLLTEANLKAYGNKIFDFLEDAVKSSETSIDDSLVLPIIQQLRKVLDVQPIK